MIALTPQLVALTTGVGAVIILVGLRRGLLEPVAFVDSNVRRTRAVCGVARHRDPNFDQERKAHTFARLRINGLRPDDLGDWPFTVVSPVPNASVS